jgi:ornithine cyclodeaminase/alanine dehydrogenase-like protein (mu-crystallin family)
MRVLTASQVAQLLPHGACIALMRRAMEQVSARQVVLPIRQFMAVPNTAGKLTAMTGAIADPARFGVKIVSKFPRPAGDPHGSHVGAVLLFDSASGLPLALMDGGDAGARGRHPCTDCRLR